MDFNEICTAALIFHGKMGIAFQLLPGDVSQNPDDYESDSQS